MALRWFLYLFLAVQVPLAAQSALFVADQTFKLEGLHTYSYALAEGDRLSLQVHLIAGRQVRSVEVVQHPGNIIFSRYNLDTLLRQDISIPKTGIYILRLQEQGLGKKICRITLHRTPASPQTARLDTRVGWDLQQYPEFAVRTRTVPAGIRTDVVPQTGRVTVPAARFGIQKSVSGYQFTLPPNTTRWAYRLSVGQAGVEARRKDAVRYSTFLQKGATKAISYVPETALAAFAIGLAIDLTTSYAGDAVEYALLTPEQLPKFEKHERYDAFIWQGGVSVDVQKRFTPLQGTYFFALRNPNWIDPLDINIDIEAVTETQLTAEEIYAEPVRP